MVKINVSNFSIEVLHKYQEDILPPDYIYYFSGDIKQNYISVEREVLAYDNNSCKLVGRCFSTIDGSFLLPVTTSGTCYLICLSDNTYNHLIAKEINPIIKE